MRFLDAEFVKGFIRMANDGWEQGWHERNGGNLSYRVKSEEVESVKENFDPKEWQPIGTTVPELAGEYFLVTGSGKYFRNVIIKPEDSICMIELDEKGENYRIVWGLVNGGRPTECRHHWPERLRKIHNAADDHRRSPAGCGNHRNPYCMGTCEWWKTDKRVA